MIIEAAKGGHTQVVKLLLEYPNRVLMNSPESALVPSETNIPEVFFVQMQNCILEISLERDLLGNYMYFKILHSLLQSRVPVQGLGNIVPPSDPNSSPGQSNITSLQTGNNVLCM